MFCSVLANRSNRRRTPAWHEEMVQTIHEHQISRRHFLGRAAAAIGAWNVMSELARIETYAQQVAADNTSKAVIAPREPLKITKLETFIHRNSWVFVKITTDAGI